MNISIFFTFKPEKSTFNRNLFTQNTDLSFKSNFKFAFTSKTAYQGQNPC